MSTYQSIDDAIYSTPDFQIIKKKKSPIMGIITTLVGIVAIVATQSSEALHDSANLSAGVMFLGASLAIFGLVKSVVAISGKSCTPVYKPSGAKITRHKFYYDFAKRDKVCACVKAGDFTKLAAIERSESSAVMVVMYHSEDNQLLLAQVFEFVPHYHEPLMETIMFNGSNGAADMFALSK